MLTKPRHLGFARMRSFAVVLSLVFFAACGGQPAATTNSSPLRIGLIGGLTGPFALYGESTLVGAQLAIDDLNAKGGVSGRKLTIVTRDDEGDPSKTIGLARELIEGNLIDGLIGSATSGTTTSILTYVNDKKFPHLMGSSSGLVVDAVKHPYSFRVVAGDVANTRVEFTAVIDTLKVKKPALLAQDDAYGTAVVGYFQAALAERPGIQFATVQRIPVNATDGTQQLINIRNAGADFVFMTAYPALAAAVVRSATALNFTVPIDGQFTSPQFFDLIPNPPTGLYSVSPKSLIAPHAPELDKVMDRVLAKEPSTFSPSWANVFSSYDAVLLFGMVVEKNGGELKGPSFKTTMESTTNYQTFYDSYTYSTTEHSHVPGSPLVLVDASKLSKAATLRAQLVQLNK